MKPGVVNARVTVELSGGAEIVSIIINASAENLDLARVRMFTRL